MKELSIEEKAKRYDKAIERARKWYNKTEPDSYTCIVKSIFPELKESEDETIRGELINFFTNTENGGWCLPSFETRKSWIAWLEKQGEMNIQNNNPLKIEPGKFYFCIKDYFAGGCYRSKKGDVVLAKNGMNMMELSPEQASEYFISINPFKENAVAWFEKQTDKPQGKLALEAIQEEMVDNANKIEPKFKVGDWITLVI